VARSLSARVLARPLREAWASLQSGYACECPGWPDTDLSRVRNVNDLETFASVERHAPDLVAVSGTNLVGRRLLGLPSVSQGFLNLHTGISPYVRGGPNCTNWCLSKGWLHLIGNTVMWLDPGIDSGPLVATERTSLAGTESLAELHRKVMDHAFDLYARAIERAARGLSLSRVDQRTIAEGRVFYNAEWGLKEMRRAIRNHTLLLRPHVFTTEPFLSATREVRMVPLPDVVDLSSAAPPRS
jgi:methionyl-tRNA formyltransferase